MSATADYTRGGTQKAVYTDADVVAVHCPLCHADDFDLLSTEYHSVAIVRCRACSLMYTSPRVIAPAEAYWGEYETFLEEARLIFDGSARHHRDPNYREELDMIESVSPGRGRLMDVGCNMGVLLRDARARGWTTVGVEPSPALHRIATEKLGLTVHNCFLDQVPASEHASVDVIALSDVFEHIPDPLAFLKTARLFLKPGGILYLKLPNARWNLLKQRMAGILGRRPDPGLWDSYERVVHYTDSTIAAMLEAGGFETVKVASGKPVQIPAWHRYVGHYYQYPSPWVLDWRRHLGRRFFYELGQMESRMRPGRVGAFAPNLVVLARARA